MLTLRFKPLLLLFKYWTQTQFKPLTWLKIFEMPKITRKVFQTTLIEAKLEIDNRALIDNLEKLTVEMNLRILQEMNSGIGGMIS